MANWRNRRLSPADEAFVADVEKRLTPPTVVNPSAVGDPNQTPVVYIGDAGKALGIPERRENVSDETRVYVGPPKPPAGGKTACCGNPKNLDGNAHPWVHVSEDGPGDVYRCPECGAVDVD